MQWIKPSDELPPQGKKILYFKKGDIYVVQRYGSLWIPIPFHDSKFAFHDEPELWCNIVPPKGFSGQVYLIPKGYRKMDVDELEMFLPEVYNELIERKKEIWVNDGMD